jgi:hydrogenase maturation factor HypF (carbamoyltransferase family)
MQLSMNLFHHNHHDHYNENVCDLCGKEFDINEDLIAHARHVHHHPIVKCHECGKEFVHEKDRLHHVREENEKKIDKRTHKWEHSQKVPNPQAEVDEHMRNYGDNF